MTDNARINLKLDAGACTSIDACVEYSRIVGDDDKGKLFTPAEYEAYKQKLIPIRINNGLYVSWVTNKSGIECKMVGPETNCFCMHRYKQHKTDFKKIPSNRPIKLPCKISFPPMVHSRSGVLVNMFVMTTLLECHITVIDQDAVVNVFIVFSVVAVVHQYMIIT